jgi:hypothetical protein
MIFFRFLQILVQVQYRTNLCRKKNYFYSTVPGTYNVDSGMLNVVQVVFAVDDRQLLICSKTKSRAV